MPSSVSLSVVVTRALTDPPAADLELEQPGIYKVVRDGLGPGAMSWRRQEVTSPNTHGSFLVGAVKEQMTAPLVIRVHATTTLLLTQRLETIVDAFSQFTYQITETIDGVVWGKYQCDCADFAVGDQGTIRSLDMLSYVQPITLSIPRRPIPVAGIM